MSEHTKEPWNIDPKAALRVRDGNDSTVCSCGTADSIRHQWESNARRIVACVNACAGINTDYLETITREGSSINNEVMQRIHNKNAADRALAKAKQQRDKLLAALKKLVRKADLSKCNMPDAHYLELDHSDFDDSHAVIAEVESSK